MKDLKMAECGCEGGGHFKCYCSEVKVNQTKVKKVFKSCKSFIKTKKRTTYGNVDEREFPFSNGRSNSYLNLSSNGMKGLKSILNISSKKILDDQDYEYEEDEDDEEEVAEEVVVQVQDTPQTEVKKTSIFKRSDKGSVKSQQKDTDPQKDSDLSDSSSFSSSWDSKRRDSNLSTDRRFEIILPD